MVKLISNLLQITFDKIFACDFCEYKCHKNITLKVHKQINHSEGPKIPKKRQKMEIEAFPGEVFIEEPVSDCPGKAEEVVKVEKTEELEPIEPFEEISTSVKSEAPIPSEQKPKFSLKGLLNKSNIKLVTSIKVFKCAICKKGRIAIILVQKMLFQSKFSTRKCGI